MVTTATACGVGFVVGSHLAATALTVVPVAGNAANAGLTYTLHQLTGRALVALYEAPDFESTLKGMSNTLEFSKKFTDVIVGLEAFDALPDSVKEEIRENGPGLIKKGIDAVEKVSNFIFG